MPCCPSISPASRVRKVSYGAIALGYASRPVITSVNDNAAMLTAKITFVENGEVSAITEPHRRDRIEGQQTPAVGVSEAVRSSLDRSESEAIHTQDVAELDRFTLATSVKRVYGSHAEVELLDRAFRDGFDELTHNKFNFRRQI